MSIPVELGDIFDEVEAEGNMSSSDLWEDGRYKLEIVRTNTGTTQKGLPKMGLQWKCLDGPSAGSTKWENVNLNPENSTSKAIFIKRLLALGLTKEFLKTNPPFEQVAAMLIGIVASVDVGVKPWKSDPDKKDQTFRVVKVINTDDPTDGADGDLYGDLS